MQLTGNYTACEKENKCWNLDRKDVFIAQLVMILQDIEDHECQQ